MSAPTVNTAAWIIYSAMRDAGYLPKGQTPSADDYSENMGRLNEIINLAQTQGLKLFLLEDLSVTLTAGTGTYTFGPAGGVVMDKPLQVVDAYYADSNGIRRPLIPMAWLDYNRLSQVTQTGQINSYFVDKQAALMTVKFWLVPDTTAATGAVHLLIRRQIDNFTATTDTSMFPTEWAMYLRWALADDICTGQPQVIMDRCERKANYYRARLEDWDVEDAPARFTPDRQGGYQTGSFR